MEPRQAVNLFITHVDKEGPFLKVWGQAEKNNSLYVEQFLLGAARQFDEGIGKLQFENLQVGTLVCAKYRDSKYYRAKITSIEYLNEYFIEVFFIDYGNKDIIPSENIRTIGNFPSSFIAIPPLATSFIFAEAHCPGGGEWTDQVFETVSKELKYREVQCSLLTQATKYYLVKLFLNGGDLGALLITRGLMQPIPQHAQQAVLLSMSLQTKPAAPSVTPISTEINTYKACTLEPGQQYAVYVSFVNDGPTHFSVQLQQSEHMLAKLMKEINQINLTMLEEVPLPGMICLARCLEDGNICRAVVTNEVDNQFKVFYVDFGNYETLPLESLYQIPFKYVLPKVMAIRLALNGIEKTNVTMEMLLAFKKFVDNRLLHMKVLPSIRKTVIPKCELWDPETKTSALDVINRAALNSYPEPLSLSRGFTQMVKVSYVFSCNRFFVQLLSKETELINLMEELQASCQTNDAVDPGNVRIGLPCCALFESDQLWYRSEIVDIVDRENVRVRYIDFGNEEVVPVNLLRQIEGELLTVLRPQAIECCLSGYQNMSADIERDNLLEELILEQQFTMKVNEMLGKKALVELIDSSNYNVASLLLDKIASAKSQVSPMLVQVGNKIEHRKSEFNGPIGENQRNNNYRNEKRPARDNKGWNNDRTNEKPWRQENRNFRNNDSESTEGSSWRNDDNYSNRNNDRFNNKGDRFNRDNRHNKFQDGAGTHDEPFGNTWDKPQPASDNNWNDTTPTSQQQPREDFRKPRDKFSQPRERYDSQKSGEWGKKDGYRKKNDFRKDGSEMSSSGSEKSFKKGPRTSSRNERGGGGGFRNHRDGFKSSSFATSTAEDSWDVSSLSSTPIDAAPSTAEYGELEVVGTENEIVISWFHNPSHFFCQLQSSQTEFKALMEDIQEFYKNRKPETCPIGSPVVGLFPEDNVLYRARILESHGGTYKVFYADFGNVASVSKVWPIEKKFMSMPAQAVCCGLNALGPAVENWPDAQIFSRFFQKDTYMARFLYKTENRTYIQLFDSEMEIAQQLIKEGLAVSTFDPSSATVEIPLLLGQQFRVILKSVNNLSDIIVALECGLALNCKMHNLESATEMFEDVLKNLLEQMLIAYVDNVVENNVLEVTFYDSDGNKLVILNPDEGSFENVEPLCPLLIISSYLSGFVTHCEENYVFIQPTECAESIDALLEKMYEVFENTAQDSPIIPEEGLLYAVHSEDTNWYRARVLTVDEDSATVRYVDYGNSEKVPFANFRELNSELMVPNMLCVQIIVALENPQSLIDKNVVATICYGESGWEGVVEVYAQVSETVEDTNQTPQKVSIPETATQVENEPIVEKQFTEPIGTPIVVSHVDSPSEFYVQFAEATAALQQLQDTLQESAEQMPVLENITIGVLCAAPYSVDHQWYRAEVLDADDDITTVRFVDYGNTDVINNKTTQIKTLPPNLLTLAVYATRCSLKLKPVEEEWSQAALDYFEGLIDCDSTLAEFIIQDEKNNYIELYTNGQNVKELFIQKNLAVPCEIIMESKPTCFVSHLNSPSEFWVQMENCVDELEWIAEQLSGAESFPELEDMSPGTLCAALFSDDYMWYRARILSNTVAGIELLFIDYGNSCISSSLRQLPEDLVVTAPLAQKCCLQRPEGIPYWTQEAQDKFGELSAEGQTIFTIRKITTGETAVVELILNGENIVSKILPVTEIGYVKDFENLDKFRLEVKSELLPDPFSLEPMPGMVWDEDSTKKFSELYPEGTLFQVEVIGEDTVRLYCDMCDIRPNLGGKKNLNLSISRKEPEEEDTELNSDTKMEKSEETTMILTEDQTTICDNSVESSDKADVTPDLGNQLADTKDTQSEETVNVEDTIASESPNVTAKIEEASNSTKSQELVSVEGTVNLESADTDETSNGVQGEETVNVKSTVTSKNTATSDMEEASSGAQSKDTITSKRDDTLKEVADINEGSNVQVDVEQTSETASDIQTIEAVVSKDATGDKKVGGINESAKSVGDKEEEIKSSDLSEEPEPKVPSRPSSRMCYDERIVPAVVSRPQSPITADEIKN